MNSAHMLAANANEFHQVGYGLAARIKSALVTKGFEVMVPAAVNFSLASELYLKAVHTMTGRPAAEIHKLWELFRTLPEFLRIQFENKYKEAIDANQIKPLEILPNGNAQIDNIETLLLKHNDSFVQWRYVHEIKKTNHTYSFDFPRMHIFCQVLNEHTCSLMGNRQFKVATLPPSPDYSI